MAPSKWKQGNGGESEAGACAIHVVTARCAGDIVSSGSVKFDCRATTVVVARGTVALGGGTDWAVLSFESIRAVLSNRARLARENV